MDSKTAYQDALEKFEKQRQALNQRLKDAEEAIDYWFQEQPTPPAVRELAGLEVLLKRRRDAVDELAVTYDDLMKQLVTLRSSQPGHASIRMHEDGRTRDDSS